MNQTTAKEIQTEFKERLDYDELMNCMRCGFCLPSCPTYGQTNQYEAASPRGRIALMKGVVDGFIEPDESVEKQLNLCLGCRACEPVCPSGVKYGHLLEEARDIIQQKKKHKWPVKVLRHLVFDQLFPHKERLKKVHYLLGFYQKSGIQKAVQKTGVLNILPGNLADMEKILPVIPGKKEMKSRPASYKAEGISLRKVAFFTGCLMDTMFLETNNATIKLLQKAGCDVVLPQMQVCCGALHAHGGEKSAAKELAKQNIAAFESLEVDDIVLNAGGCGALLVEYDHLLKDEPEWKERAKEFSEKVKDFSEILILLNFMDQDLSLPMQIITYQDSCHLRNVMKTASAPRILMHSIEGVQFREMKEADQCCGSAGIYNLTEEKMSMQILDYKMERVKETKAHTIVTANPGCLLQMKLGIVREGLEESTRAIHLADLLLESIGTE
ncbi:(Fe-S)-binding protein [Metabacillus idriensis]|uniref:(Fe-S)-binding protein n=1 Tax=Metabacillus idriensis TaxID=324768 RepID=UPI00174B591E|nr:(Fe-S)-binding protein [Metabacillus idriensis]